MYAPVRGEVQRVVVQGGHVIGTELKRVLVHIQRRRIQCLRGVRVDFVVQARRSEARDRRDRDARWRRVALGARIDLTVGHERRTSSTETIDLVVAREIRCLEVVQHTSTCRDPGPLAQEEQVRRPQTVPVSIWSQTTAASKRSIRPARQCDAGLNSMVLVDVVIPFAHREIQVVIPRHAPDILVRNAESRGVRRQNAVVEGVVFLDAFVSAEEEALVALDRAPERTAPLLACERRLGCAAPLLAEVLRVQVRAAVVTVATAMERVAS